MFRSPLLWRLYAGYVVIILICTLIVGFLVGRQVTENELQEIHHSLAVRSELLAEVARRALNREDQEAFNATLQEKIVTLGKNTESRLTVIAKDGFVIADSRESPQNMDNHLQRPEIMQARELGSASTSRYSRTLQREMMYRALMVIDGQQPIGFVRVSLPLSTIDEKLSQLRWIVLLGAGIAGLAALILGLYFAKRFTDPLVEMTEVARAISLGDFEKRIPVENNDEIGALADAFNTMAKNSAERLAELTTDRSRLTQIFTGMVEGVIGIDQDQKIIHINHAAATLLELSISSCINKPIWEQVRVQEIVEALQGAIDNQDVVKTQMRRASDNEDLVVDIHAAALRNDEHQVVGAVIVLHDISEIDHLARIRRDFVANASHELKTPITAIRGLTETILDDPAMASATQQGFIEKIGTQSIRLSTLVTDLLTISRLESEQDDQNFLAFDLSETVRRSVKAVASACVEKQLELNSEIVDSCFIQGDIQAVSQLLDNLLDNAVKYTEEGGEVSVSMTRQDSKIKINSEDTGIGISSQYQQKIFERFYRVDKARSRELGGTGLGLSIVKNIAEQHGGSVSLRSQPGVGSKFTVSFPLIDS
ncbi:MAG: ATP-binding protein [bacterium]|nr:HAMP domain-containing protein [Gammaproteobacteria bacterium]HIL94463.1 HAMP domain-containing protein [Pseudomonadales bacterium]